ncbi:hypothetical protein GF351_05625 [Candidatus Woesearchaeota archaeon]|nr:hypothetical protein [Candidatus Woesearchaeota archaeon]
MHRKTRSGNMVTFSLAALLFGAGCSKESRLKASIRDLDHAEKLLIEQDVMRSRAFAEKAYKNAVRADGLEGRFKDKVLEQYSQTHLFCSAFDDPESAVKAWWDSIGKGEKRAAQARFDIDKTLSSIYDPADPGYESLKEAFLGSLYRLYDQYEGIVKTMELHVNTSELQGGIAEVECNLFREDEPVPGALFMLYLTQKDGYWEIFDMSSVYGNEMKSVIDTVRENGESAQDTAKRFAKTDLRSALSDLGDFDEKSFWGKPMIGRYVKPLESTVLYRNGKEIIIPADTFLRVADQYTDDNGVEMYALQTTNPNNPATGKMPVSSVRDAGSNDEDIWGIGR